MQKKEEPEISLQNETVDNQVNRPVPFFPEKKEEPEVLVKPKKQSLAKIFAIYFFIFVILFSLTVFVLWKILFK